MTIDRRSLIRNAACAAAPAILRGRFALFAQSPKEYSARATQLVEEAPVVDLLNQFRFPDYAQKPPKFEQWFSKPGSFTSEDAATFLNSGIRVFSLGHSAADYAAGHRFYARWNGFLAAYSDRLLRIDDATDFARAHSERKIGIMLTMQNSTHFRAPADVDEFFALGQRISQLSYNFNNRIGSGFLEQRDGGLSVFGLSILKRMEAVGMGVDISHCGDQTTIDALEAARKPVLFTHATCRALIPGHMRAKPDDAIRKLAQTGGLMGINLIRFMVRDREPVTIEHVLDHFDHVRKLTGVQHLAIGSDLDVLGAAIPQGAPGPPISAQPNFDRYKFHTGPDGKEAVDGLGHPKRIFDLAEGLIRRGYSDADIKLILGGNAIRVLSQLWSPQPA